MSCLAVLPACFLPAQHHKEGLRGGCVQAVNPRCRRRLRLWCRQRQSESSGWQLEPGRAHMDTAQHFCGAARLPL